MQGMRIFSTSINVNDAALLNVTDAKDFSYLSQSLPRRSSWQRYREIRLEKTYDDERVLVYSDCYLDGWKDRFNFIEKAIAC